MRAEHVVGADGDQWVVRRRWAPRLGSETLWTRFRRRVKGTIHRAKRLGDGLDAVPDGCVDLDDLVILAVVVIVVVVAVFFVIPLLVAVVDALVLLLLAGLGMVGRFVFRRPWTIEARSTGGKVHRWQVVGWRASREFRRQVTESLQAGVIPRQ